MSACIHSTAGRLRIRLPELLTDETLPSALMSMRGVCKVFITPSTGSIVVYYDDALCTAKQVLKIFQTKGHLRNVYLLEPRAALVGVWNPHASSLWLAKVMALIAKLS